MLGFQSVLQWILSSSLMASVLLVIILLVKLVFKNKLSPTWHYYIWLILVLRLLLPFSLESSVSIFNTVETFTGINQPEGNTQVNRKASSSSQISGNIKNNSIEKGNTKTVSHSYENHDIGQIVLPIWIIGAILTAAYMVLLNIRFARKIKRLPQSTDETTVEILNDCKTKMNISLEVPVIYCNAVRSPSLYGFFSPRILLPFDLKDKISDSELRLVLFHELAHLKRHDNAVNWIIILLKALHWFNPLIWYAFYKLRQDCEVACDSLVLSYLDRDERKNYGYAILNLMSFISKSPWVPGATGMLAEKSQTERRITMISVFKKEPVQWTVIAVVLFITIGFVGLTDAKHEKDLNGLRQVIEQSNALQQALNEKESLYRELDTKYAELRQQTARNKILSGMTDVEGKGVILTIKDNGFSYCDDNNLREAVNELLSAGAEAISINDERFVSISEIRNAGAAVVINGREYSGPFVIKAIGSPDILDAALTIRGGVLEKFTAYKLSVEIQKKEKLFVPKFKGQLQFKYAQPVETDKKE